MEFTTLFVGAVVTALVGSTASIHVMHWMEGTKVDKRALFLAQGLVVAVALLTYVTLTVVR